MVIRDDYGPWTASTLRLSSEILLPADEVVSVKVSIYTKARLKAGC